MVKKVKEIIRMIESDGWYLYTQVGSHKQYKHSIKKGRITVPDHGKDKDIDHKTVNSILKQPGLK